MPIKLMKKPVAPVTPVYDVHVKLDPETFKEVEQLAEEEDRPLSVMIRRIVTLWLKGEVR
jgi:hypothetical protein